MNNTILILSVGYAITLICIGFLVRYSNRLKNGWYDSVKYRIEILNELIERGNKILELINSINILKNQNVKYFKICRKLYEENKILQEKITELENNKLKPKPKK